MNKLHASGGRVAFRQEIALPARFDFTTVKPAFSVEGTLLLPVLAVAKVLEGIVQVYSHSALDHSTGRRCCGIAR